MKWNNCSLLFMLACLASAGANAAGSMLRVTCGESNSEAEILVNGKLKGQCPLDIRVPEGKVRVIFRLKQDDTIQQVFITEFWIGDEVIKKVEVPALHTKGWRITLTDEALLEEGKSFTSDMKAAKAGDIEAMQQLGNLYEKGAGVAKNIDAAISWYTKAAEAGNADAMNSLGVMYATGDDVPENIEKSYFWLRKAIALGHKNAEKFMAALQNREAARAAETASDKGH